MKDLLKTNCFDVPEVMIPINDLIFMVLKGLVL